MGENPYERDRSNPYYKLPGMAERITRPDHPATVSWNDAQEFIAALNKREGGTRYRLPTEAEWEYAARAGTSTRYSFGDDERQLDRYAWHGGDFQTGGHHPVGTKQPNPWGLHDVHGNVWEWVQDWYDADYYARSPAVDPQGPQRGTRRVVRGGTWHATATIWRTAFRRDYEPDYRGISIGLRLVRTVSSASIPINLKKEFIMTQAVVVIGPGSIGQAIARRVGAGKHVLLADLRQENADAAPRRHSSCRL
ncbi:SUMF1/EgtB/PvdO family nonheme iron enzyme [Caballeronia sp. GAWG2-1]|uniref:formylglycine-generating enzyme family protein n=1 Tax=Caballeronia sp. GAWG2-1 TaxID=2921744 RepID=UPI002027AB93|nr:SUMF1/EgtB/PvdO family nonheme iron enzyme [Caballeronia sp. GAWG2-1]